MSEFSIENFVPPPKIEDLYARTAGSKFSSVNRPTSGPREEKVLPKGAADIQLYSLGTPNGHKVSILLEELEELGYLTYDAHFIHIMKGDQFGSGFVEINPNSKIPACVDLANSDKPVHLFESGSINLYFCEKHNRFLPKDPALRAQVMNWVFFQMGSQGPLTGQFGHFYVYAPDNEVGARTYGSARYGMEVQRICDVMDKALEEKDYLVNNEYSLADIMLFPWFYHLCNGYPNNASGVKAREFLGIDKYKNCIRWAETISKRPAVIKGLQVCSWSSPECPKPWKAST
jgi:GST-like protein